VSAARRDRPNPVVIDTLKGEPAMKTRVTTSTIALDKLDAAVAYWHDSLNPAARRLNGWQGAEMFVNRQSGSCVVVAQWASDDDIAASMSALQSEFAHFGTFLTAEPAAQVYDLAIKG
jgi:hypothetical protein